MPCAHLQVAVIITLVGLMESIAVAKALAERNGYDLDANQELAGALLRCAAVCIVTFWKRPCCYFRVCSRFVCAQGWHMSVLQPANRQSGAWMLTRSCRVRCCCVLQVCSRLFGGRVILLHCRRQVCILQFCHQQDASQELTHGPLLSI